MSALANIVLADAQVTPVNHTFVPVGMDKNSVQWWEDKSQASAIGFWRVSLEFKRPPTVNAGVANRVYRVRIGLHEPALENVTNSTVSGVSPAPTLSYVCRTICEFILPERSSLQNRKDIRKMIALLVADAQMIDAVENLSNVY